MPALPFLASPRGPSGLEEYLCPAFAVGGRRRRKEPYLRCRSRLFVDRLGLLGV